MGKAAIIILGAGFVAEAGEIVGDIPVEFSFRGPHKLRVRHPLVTDLARLCYPGRVLAEGESVERWFQESIVSHEYNPIRTLIDTLMRADYYTVPQLVGEDALSENPYQEFFRVFEDADFVTFNYDSFIEGSLFRLGRWFPQDGFGLEVAVGQEYTVEPPIVKPSRSLVLHLHGSALVSESTVDQSEPDEAGIRWIKPKPKEEYLFEPNAVSHLFFPWKRAHRPPEGYDPIERRVIAPVPDKSEGLRRAFALEVRRRAAEMVEHAGRVIAVGYRFNSRDRASYAFLFEALTKRQNPVLQLVDPGAGAIVDRLKASWPAVRFDLVECTFSEWHATGFSIGDH